MTILNRILAILLLLLVLAAAAGTIAITSTLLPIKTVDQAISYAPLHNALTDLRNVHPQNTQILIVAIAAVVGLIALFLLLVELTPGRRRERLYTVSQSREGNVTIAYSTLRTVADGAARAVGDVNEARCQLDRRQADLRIRCNVTAAPFTDAAAIGQNVESAIRTRLQETLGTPVEHVGVRVAVAPPGTPIRVH